MSTSAIPPIGSHVVLVRQELIKGERVAVEYAAIVFGYERANDHDVEVDGQPHLTVVYADPSKITQFGGADFTEAFDRLFSVPHEDVNALGHIFWREGYAGTTEGKDAALQAIADERAVDTSAGELGAGAAKPSADDLDTVAEEEKAKENTKCKNGKAKPVAVGK